MKKITIKKINEDIYYEKLENGLDVYLYVNQNMNNNYVTFTTKYGSIYNEVLDNNGKKIKVPKGIAHFLEHKVFVQEKGLQPEEYYGQTGSMTNAYTTFKNTTYMFSGINNLADNIRYLLDFVQNLYVTDENVESEKGIIEQEINMCNDRPDDILYDKIRENSISINPFKDSIIGTVKDIKKITPELLEKCYKCFYHPANMFLVVTGNYDKDEIMRVIKENQSKKHFGEYQSVKYGEYNEPDKVVKAKEIIKCNTDVAKMAYSVKIPIKKIDIDKRKLSIYMYILFTLLFGDTSKFDEEAKKEGIITHSIFYNILNIDSHFIVSLISTGAEYEKVIDKIDKVLANIEIDEAELERKKKVLISNEIFSYESFEMVNDMIVDNIIFDNKIEDNIIDLIRSLNVKELKNILKIINFKNKSVVILKK